MFIIKDKPKAKTIHLFLIFPDFTSSIESLQIQRGVGTSSNGVSSYGGSINFETKQGFIPSTEIQIGSGSFNSNRFSFENSTGMIGKTSFYTRVSLYNSDGYKYHSGGNGDSFFLHGGYYGKKDVFKTLIFIGNCENKLSWFGVSKDDINKDPKTNYNTNREYDKFYQSLVSLIYTRKLTDKSTITSTIYYNKLIGNWTIDLLNFGIDTLQNYKLNHNFYGLISNYNYTEKNSSIDIGIHINGYNREHSSVFEPYNENLYINTGYKNDISAFVKIQETVNKMTFFGDIQIRYTSFRYKGDMDMNNMNWTFINPKFGATYSFNRNINMYLSVGESNREPTRSDIFDGHDDPIAYNKFEPENVIDFELGTNMNWDMLNFQGNIYYMNFKNELIPTGDYGDNSLQIMKPVDKSYRSGLELNFTLFFHKSSDYILKFDNNTIYSINKIKDNGRTFQPLYTPNFIMNNMIYTEIGKFYFTIDNKFQGKSYIDWENEHTVDKFYTIGVGGGWKFYKESSINLKLNNITNQQYFTNGYVEDNIEYLFVNPPFNWFFTLKMVF